MFNGPVSVSSVSNGKDTLVELRAAGSGQHTSRDDWSASLAMDTCCCNTSLYPVAILWASLKARSSRRFLDQEVQRGPPRASDHPLASGN